MKPELPSAPVSIGGVLDSGFLLYRNSFSRCWVPALLVALAGIALGVSELMWLPQTAAGTASRLNTMQDALSRLGQIYPSWVFLGALGVILVSLACSGAMLLIDRALLQGDASASVGRALAKSLLRLPAVVLFGVIFFLIIMVAMALAATVLALLLVASASLVRSLSVPPPLQVALGVLIVVLYLLPAIYLGVKLQLALAAMFLDDIGPISAMRVSWKLTRGRWWRGFAIISVAGILIYLFQLVFGLLGLGAAGLTPAGVRERMIVMSVGGNLGSLVFYPAFMAIYVAMYHDFKLRSQGGDLAARVSAMGQT
jgi:hypothetical protein